MCRLLVERKNIPLKPGQARPGQARPLKPGHGLVAVDIIVFEVPERKNHGILSSLVVKG